MIAVPSYIFGLICGFFLGALALRYAVICAARDYGRGERLSPDGGIERLARLFRGQPDR